MRAERLFKDLLPLPRPWRIQGVTSSPEEKKVVESLQHTAGVSFPCPECGARLPVRDHVPERLWRPLDHGAVVTWLRARIPRVACLRHRIRQVQVPWALPLSRYSLAFESWAIDVLRETDVLGATRLLRISWDEAWHLMERAGARGQERKQRRVVARLGVDEKAIAEGHRSVTPVCDLEGGTVEYVADDRKKESPDGYYQSLSADQLQGIEAIAMDMWEPYLLSTHQDVPAAAAKIVLDRYHIMGHMGKAVDAVRKHEHRQVRAAGDETLTGMIGDSYLSSRVASLILLPSAFRCLTGMLPRSS